MCGTCRTALWVSLCYWTVHYKCWRWSIFSYVVCFFNHNYIGIYKQSRFDTLPRHTMSWILQTLGIDLCPGCYMQQNESSKKYGFLKIFPKQSHSMKENWPRSTDETNDHLPKIALINKNRAPDADGWSAQTCLKESFRSWCHYQPSDDLQFLLGQGQSETVPQVWTNLSHQCGTKPCSKNATGLA